MSDGERTFVKACKGFDQDYLFISYARVDKTTVESILNILYRRGFRIWYDQGGAGIPGGEDWYPTIMKRVAKSASFIAFISRATVHRPVAVEEISRALKKKREDPSYKVVFVFLEIVSSEGFPDEIKEEIHKCQVIDFKKRGGITEEFIGALCDVHWPESIVDQEYRIKHGLKHWAPDVSEDVGVHDSILWFDGTSPLTVSSRKKVTTDTEHGRIDFYTLSPDQIDPNTVYPTVMDNQWVPEELYGSEDFIREGLRCEAIAPRITHRQRQEILRSLIHNWQIIVNRASILNSKVFSDWYDPKNAEYPAFLNLLKSSAVLVYLYKEKSPVDFPSCFHIPERNKRLWLNTCREAEVCCLKFDWDNEESNAYETDLLSYAFGNFCLLMADDLYGLDALETVFRIPKRDASGRKRNHTSFVRTWQQVQMDVIRCRDKAGKAGEQENYTREQFYKSFLIDAEKTTVDSGILDLRKNPFVKELKQTVDFFYTINLPLALGVRPLLPSDSPLTPKMFSSMVHIRHLREIDVDELLFSVSEFSTAFLTDSIRLPQCQSFSLGEIVGLRDMREWRGYMRIVSEGRKRSSLNQLDFYDTERVWDRFLLFLSAAEKLLPEKAWAERPAAISIIYHFEGIKLITVYQRGRIRYRILTPVREADKTLNRKSRLFVDYSCCDVLSHDRDNLLVTELRLFEGISHGTGSTAYSALIGKFKELGFQEDRELP